jgi:hypothetical protein
MPSRAFHEPDGNLNAAIGGVPASKAVFWAAFFMWSPAFALGSWPALPSQLSLPRQRVAAMSVQDVATRLGDRQKLHDCTPHPPNQFAGRLRPALRWLVGQQGRAFRASVPASVVGRVAECASSYIRCGCNMTVFLLAGW